MTVHTPQVLFQHDVVGFYQEYIMTLASINGIISYRFLVEFAKEMLLLQDKKREESQQRMTTELDKLSNNVRNVWQRIGICYNTPK